MTILVIGDSFSFGAELSDLVTDKFGFFGNDTIVDGTMQIVPPSQLAWPALLAREFNTTVDNLSIVGGSNGRIFRLAVEQTVLRPYSLVVCAWTSPERLDLQFQGRDLAVSPNCYFTFDWVKEYVRKNQNINFDCKKWLTQMITLQSYFAQRQQPYVFIKSLAATLPKELEYLEQELNLDNCIEWSSNMRDLTRDLPKGPDGHMLESGHVRIMQLIKEHIAQRKISV